MEGPRPLQESEWPQLVRFLTSSLRPEHNWTIESEYPTALNLQNRHNIRIMTHNNEFVSHAVLRPMVIKSPSLIYKVAGIGSVVTSENYRNQGFSQQILQDCMQLAQDQKCDFAILWTHLHDFYRKMGFELAGTEMSSTITEEFTPPVAGLRYSQDKNVSAEALSRLYNQHTVGSVRTTEEIRQYLKIPQSHVYTAWKPDGTLGAFAVEGKGADLQNYIHEWGGQVPELLSLLSWIRKSKQQPVTIITPAHSHNLNTKLKAHSSQFEGFLGMIKLVDTESFFAKIKRAFRGFGVADFVLEKQGTGFLFGVGPDLLVVPRVEDLVRLLFGPVDFRVFDFQNPKSAETLSKVLPLPLWIWGWDSV
ncbi:MAG: GNAT family N-acetyltransferase [Bdellovibrionales bacterium]